MTGFLTPTHILLILVVMLLLFGAKRLPELGRSLGSGLHEFKHSIDPSQQEPRTLTAAPTSDRAINREGAPQHESVEQPTTAGDAPSPPAV